MINKKEDLVGCYVDGYDVELKIAFIVKCRELGVKVNDNTYLRYIYISNDIVLHCSAFISSKLKKQLTINDLSKFEKPIPQTKEVEWVNGDACRYTNDIEHEYIYIGEHPHGDGHYVFSEETGITYIANGYLLEPESEADKLEREELESAYDLCRTYNENDVASVNEFKLYHQSLCAKWLAIVRKTGYRKGE